MRVFSAASLFALAGTAMAGTFQMNPSWDGPNPSNVGFGLYLPTTVKPNAPLVVMIHWCQGSAQATYNNGNNGFVTLADRYGFPVIFPDSPNTAATKCWDVGSAATLKHNGGGDSYGIANFAKYVVKKYNLDPKRVFVTGGSSGAMMTQVLAGAYPDVFAAAAPSSGVPFGCWANGGVAQWNSDCAHGRITHTGAEWAQIVKNAYPGYTGSRPKIALFHGTADATVDYKNQLEAIKEWTAVLGVSETPTSTVQNSPSSGWTKTVYGSGQVEAYANQGGGHGISYQTGTMATFFGLADPPTNGPAPTTSSPTPEPTTKTPVPTTATVAPTTTVKPAPGGAKKWGQCGGSGWTGPTTCEEGSCVKVNDWYSQCQ